MIGDFLFMLKAFLMTLVLIVLLQVKIGEFTLEQKATNWARESALVQPLEEVAHGGFLALRDGWRKIYGLLSGEAQKVFESDEAPGNRSLGIRLQRSKKYIQEQAVKAKELAQKQAARAQQLAEEQSEDARQKAKEKAHQMADELSESLNYESEEITEE